MFVNESINFAGSQEHFSCNPELENHFQISFKSLYLMTMKNEDEWHMFGLNKWTNQSWLKMWLTRGS